MACRFAHTQDLDTGATTLAFELGQGMRLQSRDAMWLAISRLIEERVGQLQGVAEVRRWLLTIGEPLSFSCLLAVVKVTRILKADIPLLWTVHRHRSCTTDLHSKVMLGVHQCTPTLNLKVGRASISI